MTPRLPGVRRRHPRRDLGSRPTPFLVLGAIGVVFGDIGTSTLYAMSAVLAQSPTKVLDRAYVYGATSTMVWSLVTVVSVLYVGLLLRADNQGDGGLLALLALLRGRLHRPQMVAALTGVAMVGAATFLGDSLITPAISVLSAAEGLEVASPSAAAWVVPLAVAVLGALFALQRFGTGRIGFLFGPVMVTWFVVTGAAGAVAVVQHPGVLAALSPTWAVRHFVDAPLASFLSLGAVVLTVTGAEALYADLGHFGRPAITRGWWLVVLPALTLCYLGQAAVSVGTTSGGPNPFYLLFPAWATAPVVVLATAATIIASEAVIAGAFTVIHQAAQLGLLPSFRTLHPSTHEVRQLYLPAANALMGTGVLGLVLAFGASSRLAAAYGVAVTVTIVTTTTLYLALSLSQVRSSREEHPWLPVRVAVVVLLLGVAVTFAAATAPKIATGGWLPLCVGAAILLTMTSWMRGRRAVRAQLRGHELDVRDLARLSHRERLTTLRGGAVYLAPHRGRAPVALVSAMERDRALHELVVLLSWRVLDVPRTAGEPTLEVLTGPGVATRIVQVSVDLGFEQLPRPQRIIADTIERFPDCFATVDTDDLTYVLSVALPVARAGAAWRPTRWSMRWFAMLQRLSPPPALQLDLPDDHTILVGRRLIV